MNRHGPKHAHASQLSVSPSANAPSQQDCASKGFPSSCGADVKCVCTSNTFLDAITCCVATTCTAEEQKKTIQFAKGICGGVGVNVPDSAVCPTGGSSSSGPASSTPTSSGGSSSETGSVTGTAITGTNSPTPTSRRPSGSSTAHSSGSGSPATSTGAPTQTGNAAASVNANGGLLAAIAALVIAVA
ncbi:CFEM domain protein, putative [Trichophyton verrucosum HKI 0517]|uniref:CFEM domain protein, putative n=1 Tax=Trichophyton verrucosum (strain HKI 0517) TaxID=663202 RepID=D4D6N9_TRIVH|nr:CFEM domain protein, putative [Trichophyton verrucosum HKI 0517]EFE42458.1 CFEM domain protein, putative [Trichophyton verrucosum HKI 0517]